MMLSDLEQTVGYIFTDKELLKKALTHSSYANEQWHNSLLCNERLEFLGDSILGMMVAEHLFKLFPDRPEGELTRIRADMVCEQALARVADKLQLGQHLLLGNGEEQGGGRKRGSILADAVESLIAACYLDGGFTAALGFIQRFVLTEVPQKRLHNIDYKTALQELVQQKKSQVLTYALTGESGPDHAKEFSVQVSLNGRVVGEGIGSSKKRAEQDAARIALEKLFPEEI
jgi:ribonuclease-3